MKIIGYEMKLKTAISIVETSYAALVIIAFVGILASFLSLKGEKLVTVIILLLILLIVALFLKIKLINLYLKRGKYPFEFISVLEQLGLTRDLQINWGEDIFELKKNRGITDGFLEDNNLATDYGEKKFSLPLAVIALVILVVIFLYFFQEFNLKNNPLLFGSFLVFTIINIYFLLNGKKRRNDDEPVLSFKEKGILLYDNLYLWDKIKY